MAGHRAWVGTMAAEKGREGEKGKAIHSNRSLAGGKTISSCFCIGGICKLGFQHLSAASAIASIVNFPCPSEPQDV